MSLNYTEIDKIIEEIDLKGAILQKVIPITYESFTFCFYKPKQPINIQVSVDRNCRIFKESRKNNKLGKTHNLVEYIKAKVLGGRVKDIAQLNNNRIVQITLMKKEREFLLIFRLWGGFANIFITDPEYKILHLHKKSSKKKELPSETLIIPSERKDPNVYLLKEHNFSSYNEYIEEFYETLINKEESLAKEVALNKHRIKRASEIETLVRNLEGRLKSYTNPEEYKLYGDLILSNIQNIKNGDKILQTIDYRTDSPIEIRLDPKLNANQNSQQYYKRFSKASSGISITNQQIKELLYESSQLVNLKILPMSNTCTQKNKTVTGLTYSYMGWQMLVGRNAKENDKLLRHIVKGNDLWFHIRDYPGGYVFILNQKNKTVPLQVIKYAGGLALYYSRGKNCHKADITYTHVKYLRRVKKGKQGQVIPTMTKNIYVTHNKNILYSES